MARRRRAKRNTWFGQPRRHRKAAIKGWRRGHKGVRRRKHRRNYFTNPAVSVGTNPRRRRRNRARHTSKYRRASHRRRRNPAISLGGVKSAILDVRGWAPLAITGSLSAVTGAVAPGMLGIVNPYAKLGVQLGVAIVGGQLVEKFIDKRHGEAWMIVGVSLVAYQVLKQYVFVPYFPQFAVGLGGYQAYYPDGPYANELNVSQQVGAFPNSMSAFPNDMSDYPGVGAMQEDVGAYPYDGSGY